jgi:UDPglucose--hexose-1-phosphate uridylyltransferase
MPEIRRDPIVDRWVAIAEERASRPDEFATDRDSALTDSPEMRPRDDCRFCPGNEHCTPGSLLERRVAGSDPIASPWHIRVFDNRYPAVTTDASLGSAADASAVQRHDLFHADAGYGMHEVVVDSAMHGRSISQLSAPHVVELLRVYQQRVLAMRQNRRLRSALVFKNVGRNAGASVAHAHTQIVGSEQAVPLLLAELAGAKRQFDAYGRCVYCRMIAAEEQAGERIVIATNEAIAFCPFASRFAYEAWIIPRNHQSHFELDGCVEFDERAGASTQDFKSDRSVGSVAAVARLVRRIISRLEKVLDRPAYNYVIHSAPFDLNDCAHYHWHVELMPRTSMVAGFELGGGAFINAVPPERAAAMLRAAKDS